MPKSVMKVNRQDENIKIIGFFFLHPLSRSHFYLLLISLFISSVEEGMGWFLFKCKGLGNGRSSGEEVEVAIASPLDVKKDGTNGCSTSDAKDKSGQISAKIFSYSELAAATSNFREDSFLGEGGFGQVYKGRLEATDQIVAIKQLDRNGLQGNREFHAEVSTLGTLHHRNLVNLIGYCSDGDQRLLVYEYMPLGSLEDHLYNPYNRRPLDWSTRMQIASDAAKGLEYLHNQADPPVIYRDLKCTNILLGEGFHAKLSDFGLAKFGPTDDKSHVSTRVMGTYGYCAPEYAMTGQLTLKSDIYSFGVVLLEIITGRRAYDETKCAAERNLVGWARPFVKDRKRFRQVADPALEYRYPSRGLYQALAVAAMCVQEKPTMRPLVADVVTALTYLASHNDYLDTNLSPTLSRVATSGPPRIRRN